jgi:hypothetical protein
MSRGPAITLFALLGVVAAVAVTSVEADSRSSQIPSDVVQAVNLACATYGHCADLWRKASCETGGTFSPTARNPSGATGLYQFLPSTWQTTPYSRFPMTSPYASALAAGWMHSVGRGGEWACR